MKLSDKFVNKIICGDALEAMKAMEPEAIDMCMTSPPYFGLRDYGTEQIFGGDKECGHKWGVKGKSSQRLRHGIGSYTAKVAFPETLNPSTGNYCLKCHAWKGQLGFEPTPEIYIDHLTEIFNEIKRVLKKEGTLWLNIGDTYNAGRSGGWPGGKNKPWRPKIAPNQSGVNVAGLPPKCLCMIPERLAWALIQNGWILRNKIIWYKPNAMPSSVKDRFSNQWEYIFLFSKNKKYYFDLDAVREPHTCIENRPPGIVRDREWRYKSKQNILRGRKWAKVPGQATQTIEKHSGYYDKNGKCLVDFSKGKNPGDVFNINTSPFPEAHFAVFPEKLCEKPIKAGCPEWVCKKCGKARERMVEKIDKYEGEKKQKSNIGRTSHGLRRTTLGHTFEAKTIGWTSCNCNAGFEGGIVLDPFCGAGTVAYVARDMKRQFVGIDIKKEYCEMAEKRLNQGVL